MIHRVGKIKIFSWYDSTMDWRWNISNLWGKVTGPLSNFFGWIIKSFQYSIFLKKDFDWDYCFILDLLEYKIRRTRKCIVKNNLILASKTVALEMLHVEELIKKYKNNDFCQEDFDAHCEKWGDIKIECKNDKTQSGLNSIRFMRDKVKTEKDYEQERKEYRFILDKQSEEIQKCWNDIFDYMKLYMRGWWD